MNLHPAKPIVVMLTRMESMRMAIALTADLWSREGYPSDAIEYAFTHQGRLTDCNGELRPVAWATSLTVKEITPITYGDWDGGAPE